MTFFFFFNFFPLSFGFVFNTHVEKNHSFLSSSSSSSSIWFFSFWIWCEIPFGKKIIYSSHHLHHHHPYGFFFLDLVWNPIRKKIIHSSHHHYLHHHLHDFSLWDWCEIPFGKKSSIPLIIIITIIVATRRNGSSFWVRVWKTRLDEASPSSMVSFSFFKRHFGWIIINPFMKKALSLSLFM